MLWALTMTLLVVGTWAEPDMEGRKRPGLTWAQVASDGKTDYDDSFFRNHDYEYVDPEEVELPPPPERGASPHKLERRTLGYILGTLVEDGSKDVRPARSSALATTPPPSSFLEYVMRSIDNFVVEDLRGWSKFFTAMNSRTTTTTTTTPRPAPAPQQGSGEVVVVQDEYGRHHVVTINDIVASLSQLDENTITELLLGPTNPAQAPKAARAPASAFTTPTPASGPNIALADAQSRLPSHTQSRSPASPTERPIHVPTISPINSIFISSTSDPPISHTRGPPISTTRGPTIRSTNSPIISSSHSPSISPARSPSVNLTRGPTFSSISSPTQDPIISSRHSPSLSPARSPSVNFTRGPTFNSFSSLTQGPIVSPISSINSATRGPTAPTRNPAGQSRSSNHIPNQTFSHGTSTRGPNRSPTRTPPQTPVHGTPTRTLAQVIARGPTRSPDQALVRDTPTRTSWPSVVRATPIHIPTGISTRVPGRPDVLHPDFLIPSASGSPDNTVRRSSKESVLRPVRHTNPTAAAATETDEMILVRDETGAVHVVTIQDIISSLAALSSENAKDLLFGDAPVAPPATLNLLQDAAGMADSGAVAGQRPPRGSGTVQVSGSLVRTDAAGNVHVESSPGRPFNVQDIIAAAEEPQLPRPATADHAEQLLSSIGQQNLPVPATSTRPSLVDALRQQDIPESLVQYIASPSVIRPITQAAPIQQPTPGGLGATISGLFSRLVGGQQQQQQQQVDQGVMGQVSLALPRPIHFQAGDEHSPNALQDITKSPANDVSLPAVLRHLSPAVQAALRQQANDVPTFVPPGATHAEARADTDHVEFISVEEEDESSPPAAFSQEQTPVTLPPSLLKKVPPSVLRKVTKQYMESRVGEASPSTAQDRDYYEPVAHYYEVHHPVIPPFHPPIHGFPPPVPDYPPVVYQHHAYPEHGYVDDGYTDYGDLHPMLDIFLLADVTKVHKVGDTNLSMKAPKVGDPSYFVDTRPHEYDSH